jgi:hypothetical protein
VAAESFFSGPNVSWFLVGIFAEVAFLGIGVSPWGMQLGTDVAIGLGIIEPFSAAADGAVAMAEASNGIQGLAIN